MALPRIQTTDTAGTAFRAKSNELYGQLFNDGFATEGGAIVLTAENKTLAVDLGLVVYTADALTERISQFTAQVRGEMSAFFSV